jgi:hypothetical protein
MGNLPQFPAAGATDRLIDLRCIKRGPLKQSDVETRAVGAGGGKAATDDMIGMVGHVRVRSRMRGQLAA